MLANYNPELTVQVEHYNPTYVEGYQYVGYLKSQKVNSPVDGEERVGSFGSWYSVQTERKPSTQGEEYRAPETKKWAPVFEQPELRLIVKKRKLLEIIPFQVEKVEGGWFATKNQK